MMDFPIDSRNVRLQYRLTWLMALMLACLTGLAGAAEVPEHFIRVAEDDSGGPLALQVAVARYRDESGRSLDLIGAVHVGDRDYYAELNRRFEAYEAVLYELVGDPESGEGPAGPGLALVSLLQGGMKDALGLAFQLDEIDYERPNLVHADMTPAEFEISMADREESMLGTFMQLYALSLAAEFSGTRSSNAMLLRVLMAEDKQRAAKQVLAESLAEQQKFFRVLEGKDGSTLITERNRKALAVLERELADGAERLALFYGAGHMPDFHRRLTGGYGFELTRLEWVDAWDLR